MSPPGTRAPEPLSVPPTEPATGEEGQPYRFAALLLAVIASVAVQGTVAPGDVQRIVVSALLAVSLVLAFQIARVTPALKRVAAAVAVAGVTVAVLSAVTDTIGDGEARVMNAVLVLLGPPAVGLGVMRSLRSSREVRVEAVMGVLSLYMLLGMLFAFVYGAIDRLGGDPFFADGLPATVPHCLYFSFTTLTTAGFGDFTARSDLGHTLTVFEALIGQIYLVTVVSVIVSNLGGRDRRGRP